MYHMCMKKATCFQYGFRKLAIVYEFMHFSCLNSQEILSSNETLNFTSYHVPSGNFNYHL